MKATAGILFYCKSHTSTVTCDMTPKILSVAWVGIIKHSHIVQSVEDEQQCSEVHPTLLSFPPDP